MIDHTNRFKRALAAGEPQIGLWIALADPYAAEICAGAGFDWMLLDGEHSPADVRTILSQLQAAAAYPAHAVVRPPIGDAVIIKRLLDLGAQTLLVPMVDTAEQAAAMVAATRYPPRGVRGVGAGLARASRWGLIDDYVRNADEEICLLLQVETVTGIRHLDEIAATDGVDGVFIGAVDLSASMGYRGQAGHPAVRKAVSDAIARIRDAGKAAGVLNADIAGARAALAEGATFVAVGADTMLLAEATRRLAAEFKPAAAPARPAGY